MAVDSFARTLIFSMESKQSGVKEVEGISPISSSTGSSGIATVIHEDSGVTAGTYNSVTVNATGHVTNGTNPTTLSGYGITDALNSTNPTGIGSLSMNRLDGSTVGINSVTEGYNCTASGNRSHAEGNSTTASGTNSHTEGSYTTASETNSHAEGSYTTASGINSHTEGSYTTASGINSHVEGQYNVADTANIYAHIIGNGTSDTARSNAFTVDWSGNVVASGDVTSSGGSLNLAYSTLSDLQAFVGYTDTDIYGVEVDFKNKVCTRLAGAVNKTPGAMFDGINAFGGRKRCIVTDTGKVLAYFGEAAYTETGALLQAVTQGGITYAVGTAVQVMVEQPAFWYRAVPIDFKAIPGRSGFSVQKIRYYISETDRFGFKLHPAFYTRDTSRKKLSKIYLSAYEGCLYDTSESAYLLNDEQIADFTATTGDKLSSIASAKPVSGLTQDLTRAKARIIAKNRGTGWQLEDIFSNSASQLLFAIEYGSFDSQTKIGQGVVNKADDGATNQSEPTGATYAIGNGSGMAVGTNGLVSIIYRGQENFWGNIWKWEDGLNVYADGVNNQAYIAYSGFADSLITDPYFDVGFELANADGYVSAIGWSEICDFAFLATETLGASNKPIEDYFYQNAASVGDRVSLLGGSWNNGTNAGAFYRYVDSPPSVRARTICARLLFVPAS